MNNKLYSMLGICRKSGNLFIGSFRVEKSINDSKSYLVIISCDASNNTKEKFINLCKTKNVPYLLIGNKELIGKSIGKNDVAVVSIADVHLSNKIINLAKEVLTGGGE
ncbi:ribosomal L7Ae/L30e/S12e/Gadd45 family protein [Thermoanaerobacterium sp. RBIITD]|uniref:L7Ae/L30e/S12e/Gadd45 family ribosomal protein n=1 Tax=Thermoanaerobacterium sp. RBIITD TaxID=1550240 RepID=UPI000BB89B02|nr:ribosomal L7Ae/L30e/S12e/Gadd45 family protein [Thermoanaerobacterium sp. RBIITD]SNX55475.1 Ribosomal protein L7Ae [Thermoanaerobacterium sp. RBIITD]